MDNAKGKEASPELLKEVEQLVDYLWDDEERDYRHSEDKHGHVFESVRAVRTWLDTES